MLGGYALASKPSKGGEAAVYGNLIAGALVASVSDQGGLKGAVVVMAVAVSNDSLAGGGDDFGHGSSFFLWLRGHQGWCRLNRRHRGIGERRHAPG